MNDLLKPSNTNIADEYLNQRGHFHYRTCGLDNVFLKDGFSISDDGESYSISNLQELHECISLFLVNQTSNLAAKELKFLRQELKLTQSELSKKVGVDVQTVARWEKGETENRVADRMLRLMYMDRVKKSGNDLDMFGFLDAISELDDTQRSWIFHQDTCWKKAA